MSKDKKDISYYEWRKKSKKKHTPSLVYKFIERYFKLNGVDISRVSSTPQIIQDIYWHLVSLETRLHELEHAN